MVTFINMTSNSAIQVGSLIYICNSSFLILLEANCCTSWSEACYTTPSHDNYGHPCNKTDGACEDVCVSNEDSAECQKCCISVTHDSTHGTTWDCGL